MKTILAGALIMTSLTPAAAVAQPVNPVVLSGTRLDVAAVGEVTRVPDIAIISAGVSTRAASAGAAISDNAAKMEQVRATLRRAGIADRDIQTSTISLQPDYRYDQNQPPVLTGYNASNQVSIRFRDIRRAGTILDALVAAGANQINGPSFSIDKPETALDEARTRAVAQGRARADLYARSLGMRVVRLLSVSEVGDTAPVPVPIAVMARDVSSAATKIDPGEQKLQVNVTMSFELR